jgi:hypothetical protein
MGAHAQRDYEAIDAVAAKRTLRFLQIRSRTASDDGSGGESPAVA